jgi:hypothetical protein
MLIIRSNAFLSKITNYDSVDDFDFEIHDIALITYRFLYKFEDRIKTLAGISDFASRVVLIDSTRH